MSAAASEGSIVGLEPPAVAAPAPERAVQPRGRRADRTAYGLFILLMFVTLVNLPARIPMLGYLHPTILLVVVITGLIWSTRRVRGPVRHSTTSRLLMLLTAYVFLSLPFVQWPGSVIGTGLDGFLPAVVFFFFPLYLIDTHSRLRRFVMVFMLCQVFRVLEPLYLHFTTGYWGSRAHMEGSEFMDRLSGAPKDTINPNGLAFVVLTALPFLHFIFGGESRARFRVAYLLLLPPLLYALILTGSRSGIIGLAVVYLFIIARSRHRLALILVAAVAAMAMLSVMDENSRDRYLSIFSHHTKNAATSQGRISGTIEDFQVGLRRPVFGHGIGTSREANANFLGVDLYAHNIYAEAFIELGAIGLLLFLALQVSIIRGVLRVRPTVRRIWLRARGLGVGSRRLVARLRYYEQCSEAVFVLAVMCVVFSFASYGLRELYWYFTAGLTVSLRSVVRADSRQVAALTDPAGGPATPAPTA